MPEKPEPIDDTVIIPQREPENDDVPAGPYTPWGKVWRRRSPFGGYIPGRGPVPGHRVPPPGGMWMSDSPEFPGGFPGEDDSSLPLPVGDPRPRGQIRIPRVPPDTSRPSKGIIRTPSREPTRRAPVQVATGWTY